MRPVPQQETGMQLLEATFDASMVRSTIDFELPQTYLFAMMIGWYRSQMKE